MRLIWMQKMNLKEWLQKAYQCYQWEDVVGDEYRRTRKKPEGN